MSLSKFDNVVNFIVKNTFVDPSDEEVEKLNSRSASAPASLRFRGHGRTAHVDLTSPANVCNESDDVSRDDKSGQADAGFESDDDDRFEQVNACQRNHVNMLFLWLNVFVESFILSRKTLTSKKPREFFSCHRVPFTLTIHGKQTRMGQRERSFQLAKGCGSMHVRLSSPRPLPWTLTQVIVGNKLLAVNHAFSSNENVVYCSPEHDFLEEADANGVTIQLYFENQ